MKSSGGRAQSLSAENLSDEFNVYRLQDDANIIKIFGKTKNREWMIIKNG